MATCFGTRPTITTGEKSRGSQNTRSWHETMIQWRFTVHNRQELVEVVVVCARVSKVDAMSAKMAESLVSRG